MFSKEYIAAIDKKLITFIKGIRKEQKEKWDVVIAITGYPGIGKSSLAIEMSWLIDNKYTFEKNACLVPTASEIEKKYYGIEEYGVMHIDEASRALHKYRWWDSAQQKLNTLYDTEREFHYKATVFLMPRFQDLSPYFRNFRVRYWINIIDRGVAIVYKKDEDKDAKDPWHLDENYSYKYKKWWLMRKRVAERSVADIIRVEEKLPNYWFWFEFPQLPKEIEERFSALKKESRIELRKQDAEKEKPGVFGRREKRLRQAIYLGWIKDKKENPKLSYSEYAKAIGYTAEGLSELIQREGETAKEKESADSIINYNINKRLLDKDGNEGGITQ